MERALAIQLRHTIMGALPELRLEPIEKRIRGRLGDETVIDSTAALLVWEPRRVVPTYGFPVADISGEILEATQHASPPADSDRGIAAMGAPMLGDRPVLDPSVPFDVRATAGTPKQIRARVSGRHAAAFAADDPALADHLIVDFDGFDAWLEEDELNVGHPRDPFHRIDIVHSSRHVRIELDGQTIAESRRARFLFEPPLPVRFYLPRADVDEQVLQPSATITTCAYKGHASYWSVGEHDDIAWTYEAPLREAAEIAGYVAFLSERTDVFVDGQPLKRPVTPWSRP